MTLEEFWKISFGEDNVLEHYEGVKQLFSKPLEEEIPDNYSLSLPLIDIKGGLKRLKEYARMEELIQIFKAHHFEAYREAFYYYRTSLTEYYLHENDVEGLERCIVDFIEMPIEGYDDMMQALRKMQVYGQIDLVDKLICGIYDTVVISDRLARDAAFDLALIKSHVELEKVYVNYKKTDTFDWEAYNEILPKFGFDTEDRYLALCELSLGASDAIEESVRASFDEDRNRSLEILEKAFMKYMLDEKDMPFALSAYIWNYLFLYWEGTGIYTEEVQYDIETYFGYHADAYRSFLGKYSGFIMDYRFSSVALLWGVCYVYDFLRTLNLITDLEYEDVQTTVRAYKYDLIYENLSSLWLYSFVNDWKKSGMETDEEKQKIKAIFDEYYDATPEKIRADTRGHFFTRPRTEPLWLQPSSGKTTFTPIKSAPKIGRNEKVTVEYKDGTVKKDVKYKKVKTDVEMERCKII